MEKASIDDVDPFVFEGSERRGLSEPLGTTGVAVNHYRIPAGEGFPAGLHAHMDQEELFVVLEGEATFETLEGEICVEAGEVIRFAPGDFQSGRNDADDGEELVALALGAPHDTENIRIPAVCRECEHENVRLDLAGDGPTFVCPACDREFVPQACPECGHEELRVTLADSSGGRTVTVCQGCEAEFDEPPVRA